MDNNRYDWNAKLVRFFVSNPRLVWLIIISIIIGGVASLANLRREGFPQISPKVVLIQTTFPGASANEVESQVTRPIESAVKDVKSLKEFSSTSQNSFSNVVVQLEESTNLDQAVQDIQSKIQRVRTDLPKEIDPPEITTFNTGGAAFIFGVSNGKTDLVALRKQADSLIAVLNNVKGVKLAKYSSEKENRVVIAYDLEALQTKGISLTTLSQVIPASNANIPAGNLTIDDQAQSAVAVGSFSTVQDLQNLIVGVDPATGQVVKLKDVATISSGIDSKDEIERFGYDKNGAPTIVTGPLISVEINKDADIIATREAILDEIEAKKLSGDIPTELDVIAFSDQGKSTQDQVTEIVEAAVGAKRNLFILGGLQLLFFAMLLFVNWRAALVAAASIPLSLGITFITLDLLGVQLNTIVLFSLILVLGLIVDPAVVMVEAIQRYLDIHYSRQDSVLESGRRYGASLFMAVLTSLIVFVPFGVVSGIFGEIIKYIPLTVIPALVASYFVPIALLPLLSQRFLRQAKGSHSLSEEENLPAASRVVMNFNRWILGSVWRELLVLVITFVLVGLSFSLVANGKVSIVQFSTPQDNEEIAVKAVFKKGLPPETRDATALEIEKMVLSNPAVKQQFYLEQGIDSTTLFVTLKDKDERKEAGQKSKAVVQEVKNKIASIQNLDDYVVTEIATGPPQSDYQIQTQIYDNDTANLETAAKTIGTYIKGLDHVVRVNDGFTNQSTTQVQIILNRDKVAQAGLTSAEVGQQLRGFMTETKVTKFEDTSDKQTKTVYIVNDVKPSDIAEIKRLTVTSRTGTQVRVGDIAQVTEVNTVDSIQRFNGLRYVNIQARVDDSKNTLAVQKEVNTYLTPEKIKSLGLDSREDRGDSDDIAQSFRELGIALVIAVILTYIVLVLQFKSFSLPAIMLFTIPLSFIGIFPALWLTNSDLGFLELLGVTILVGIVENVAIFLIDYANQLVREKGKTPKEAIIQSSGVRFRPILLTKVVAIGGLLPLAIGSQFWRGLSVVIIAGIGLSGFFSLAVIPILYVWINNFRRRIHKANNIE